MAQYGDQHRHGHVENHEFGNPEVYENTGANMGERGGVTHEATKGLSSAAHPQTLKEKLHRSGSSSSSSSSEEEGEGGIRKKKGLTKKIKEKIPGVGPKEQSQNTTTTPTTTKLGGEHGEEKKGMVDKIKEKLPGHN